MWLRVHYQKIYALTDLSGPRTCRQNGIHFHRWMYSLPVIGGSRISYRGRRGHVVGSPIRTRGHLFWIQHLSGRRQILSGEEGAAADTGILGRVGGGWQSAFQGVPWTFQGGVVTISRGAEGPWGTGASFVSWICL